MSGASGKKRSRIHEGLVGARALVGTPYLRDQQLREAYDAEIAPRTTAMLNRVLQMHLQQLKPSRVLDLGAGTGVVGKTLRERFGPDVVVTAVDRVSAPGVIVADLRKAGRPAGVQGRFDLIVAAHLLNEFADLAAAPRAHIVLSWLEHLMEPDGHLILIEPALKETSRALLQVRDELVSKGVFIAAPCLHQGPCPALGHPRDWCHDSAPRPGQPRADFSFLVLRRDGQPHTDPSLFRAVSDMKREKGRQRLFACGPRGRHPLVLQNRDESSSNQTFLELDRGQLLRVVGLRECGDGLRLDAASQVTRPVS